jgi:hypothetical protein
MDGILRRSRRSGSLALHNRSAPSRSGEQGVLLINPRSSVRPRTAPFLHPTGFSEAAVRSGRQGRLSGRRASARLALYGREHGGMLGDLGTALISGQWARDPRHSAYPGQGDRHVRRTAREAMTEARIAGSAGTLMRVGLAAAQRDMDEFMWPSACRPVAPVSNRRPSIQQL